MNKTPEMMISVLSGAQKIVEAVDIDHGTDDRLFAVLGAMECVKEYLEQFTQDAWERKARASGLDLLE